MSDIVERLRERKEPTIEVDIHYPQIVCSDVPDDECIEAADEITRLRAEVSELNSMFDAQWNADMAGVQMWREAHPGNDMVLPDRKRFTAWILAENEKLRAALREIAKHPRGGNMDTPAKLDRDEFIGVARAALEEK